MKVNIGVLVLENNKPESTLEPRVTQAALRYFSHVVKSEKRNDAMLGGMIERDGEEDREQNDWTL